MERASSDVMEDVDKFSVAQNEFFEQYFIDLDNQLAEFQKSKNVRFY